MTTPAVADVCCLPPREKRPDLWLSLRVLPACRQTGTSLRIQELIRREFGVLYNRFYICQLLRNLGYSFQKAKFVSDPLDEQRRAAWINEEWPRILCKAKRLGALILFEDEASFPQ